MSDRDLTRLAKQFRAAIEEGIRLTLPMMTGAQFARFASLLDD